MPSERLVPVPHRHQSVRLLVDQPFVDVMRSGLPACPNERIVERGQALLDAAAPGARAVSLPARMLDHVDITEEITGDLGPVMCAPEDQEIEISCAALDDGKPIIVMLSDLLLDTVGWREATPNED